MTKKVADKNDIINKYREIFGDGEVLTESLMSSENLLKMAYKTGDGGEVFAVGFARKKHLRVFSSVINVPYIFGIGTDCKHRGKGFATGVITDLITELSIDYPLIMLSPATENLYNFYGKFGFCIFDGKIETRGLLGKHIQESKSKTVYERMDKLYITKDERDGANSVLKDVSELFNLYNVNADISQYRTYEDTASKSYELIVDDGHIETHSSRGKLCHYRFVEDGKICEEISNSPLTRDELLRNGNKNTMIRVTKPKELFTLMQNALVRKGELSQKLVNVEDESVVVCKGELSQKLMNVDDESVVVRKGELSQKLVNVEDESVVVCKGELSQKLINIEGIEGKKEALHTTCNITLHIADPILGDSILPLSIIAEKVVLLDKLADGHIINTDISNFTEWLLGNRLISGAEFIPYPFGIIATIFYDKY